MWSPSITVTVPPGKLADRPFPTPATIGMDVREAARVAAPAWDLDDVARTLTGHAERLESALREPGPPAADGATLRRLADLFDALFIDLLRDPRLPPELRPATGRSPDY